MLKVSSTLLAAMICGVCGLVFATIPWAATGEHHYIQEEDTPVHESPNANAPVVIRLKRGDRVIEYRRQGVWVKVGVFGAVGKEGWVDLSHLGPEAHAPTPVEQQEAENDLIIGSIGTPPIKKAVLLVDFLVRITGPPAHRFEGHCDYIDKRGKKKKFRIDGIVPEDFRVKAKAIRCFVLTDTIAPGRLKMAMWGDGQFLRSISMKRRYRKISLATPWNWN